MTKLKLGNYVSLRDEEPLARVVHLHNGNAIAEYLRQGCVVQCTLTPDGEGKLWNKLF